MYKGTLTKIKSNHGNLRTTSMEGSFTSLPQVGQGFVIYGEGLEFGMRMIHTTQVKKVLNSDGIYFFETENSSYRLDCD